MPRGLELTMNSIQRQIAGMGGDQFEIGILDQSTGRMMLRRWDRLQLFRAVPWLRHQNFFDANIYVRPLGPSALILLDDVLLGTIKKLVGDGFQPATVIETSPLNFQAWLRLSESPVSNELRSLAARELAKIYGADPASADWRHFGRLGGFTNRKPSRREDDGRYPFVKVYDSAGEISNSGESFLQSLDEVIQKKQTGIIREQIPTHKNINDPVKFFLINIEKLKNIYRGEFDASKGDWASIMKMAQAGYSRMQIEEALAESPNLNIRKMGHQEDYIQRTIRKLFQEDSFPED
jgi:hypothetical protein